MTSTDLVVDERFVSRLLLGALSENEQRMLTARLARSDPEFRASLGEILEPFELLDADLAGEYATALDQNPGESIRLRHEILARSYARAEHLEALLSDFTLDDALELGGMTRELFSWSIAELLLERSLNSIKEHRARTSLYLASMVIDIIDLLGSTGHTAYFANVITDVRQRIREAADRLTHRWALKTDRSIT